MRRLELAAAFAGGVAGGTAAVLVVWSWAWRRAEVTR